VEPAPPLSSKIAPEPDTEETEAYGPSSGTPTSTPSPKPEPDAEEASPALDETPPITTALAPKNDDKDEDASSKKKDSCLDDWYPFKCTAKMLGF
jgi:hypothetical protein